jgi:hypothetical protein
MMTPPSGCIGSFLSIQTYIIDNFTLHAASALAAGASLRSLAGFGFPLFAEAMFSKLGVGGYLACFPSLFYLVLLSIESDHLSLRVAG